MAYGQRPIPAYYGLQFASIMQFLLVFTVYVDSKGISWMGNKQTRQVDWRLFGTTKSELLSGKEHVMSDPHKSGGGEGDIYDDNKSASKYWDTPQQGDNRRATSAADMRRYDKTAANRMSASSAGDGISDDAHLKRLISERNSVPVIDKSANAFALTPAKFGSDEINSWGGDDDTVAAEETPSYISQFASWLGL